MITRTPIARGFTLIELMVAISIISFLSSILFVSVSVAKAKANDARKIATAAAVRTAIQGYVTDKNEPPPVYTCTSGGCLKATGSGSTGIVEVGDSSGSFSDLAFQETMSDLVEAGYLTAIPESPDDTPYMYQNMGNLPGSLGGVFSVVLKTGRPGSSSNAGTQCQIPATVFVENMNGTGQNYIVYRFPDFTPNPPTAGCQVWTDAKGNVTSYGNYFSSPYGQRCLQPPRCIQHTNSACACSSL